MDDSFTREATELVLIKAEKRVVVVGKQYFLYL